MALYEEIQEAVKVIRKHSGLEPEIAVILGTGLGALAEDITDTVTIPYEDIPHFPLSTLEAHAGNLLLGNLGGKKIVAMQGRFHRYEGYDQKQITYPVRVMRLLGAHTLIAMNAAGGMNIQFSAGDIMLITDHINLMGDNPLVGPNDERLGPRFPDMSEPYTRDLIALAERIGMDEKISLQRGVYVALPGPCLETAAEYRFLKTIGADAVGMSTVPEIIVAVHCGMKTLGLSCITDECRPDCLNPADIQEIIRVAMETEPKLRRLVRRIVEEM